MIYGESEAKDCAVQDECSTKQTLACVARNGMMISYFSTYGKSVLPIDSINLPMRKIRSDASWGGKSTYEGI